MTARDDSRIIFAYGADTLAKIGQLKTLIIGMRGVPSLDNCRLDLRWQRI